VDVGYVEVNILTIIGESVTVRYRRAAALGRDHHLVAVLRPVAPTPTVHWL